MKTFTFFLLWLAFTTSGYGQTPANRPEKDAVPMLKLFYTDYLAVFATAVGSAGEKNLVLLQRQFCTPAFFKKLPALIRQGFLLLGWDAVVSKLGGHNSKTGALGGVSGKGSR